MRSKKIIFFFAILITILIYSQYVNFRDNVYLKDEEIVQTRTFN